MALLDGPLLFPNSPGTGLLSRARNWWNSDLDRQERLRAMFSGWAQGRTPQESLGLGAASMQDARGDIRERRQQEEASRAIMGLLGGDAVSPGAFPALSNPGAPRAVSGGLLGGGASVQPQQGMAGYDAGMDSDVTGGPVTPRPVSYAGDGNLPRGWRNNNPGNIEAGSFTQGLPGYAGSDGRFARFETPEQGIAAADALLSSYANRGYDTVSEIINRWAPQGENNTLAYINAVARNAGVDPNKVLTDEERARVRDAMFLHENGMARPDGLGTIGATPQAPVQTAQAGTGGLSSRARDILRIMMMPGAQAQMPVLQVLLQQEMAANAPQSLDPTDDMREYEFARQQGYTGSFFDFQRDMRQAGATRIENNLGPNGIQYPDPEEGYDYVRNPDGSIKVFENNLPRLEMIPGGEPWRTAEEAAAQGEARDATVTRAADVVTQDIDRALSIIESNPNLTTGIGGVLTGWVPGQPSFNLNSLIDTVRSNVGFDKLQAMRDASPTGGALGQVSQQENLLLQATIGNLATSQGTEQLVDNLNRVYNIYLDIVHGPGNGPPRRALKFQGPQPVELPSGRQFLPPDAGLMSGGDVPSSFQPPAAPPAAPPASGPPTHIWTPEGGLRPVQ
jgi:hypothetical protein